MAEIVPFKGILYNTQQIGDLAKVVTPPYDVISPKEQDNFYRSHPNNMVRLILGKTETNDTTENNPHTRAFRYFNQWINDGVLIRDDTPAFYLQSIEFKWNQRQYVRHGLTAAVRIEPFKKGIILPHEKTYSRVKSERLELMKACNINFDPIFALFPDKDNLLTQLNQEILDQTPDIDFVDHLKQRHCLWRLTNTDLHSYITTSFTSEILFIADGHHRYETALSYRNWLIENNSPLKPNHPANFVLMYLSSMKDPGLIILPAHRLLKKVSKEMIENALIRGRNFFDILSFSFKTTTREKIQAEFISRLHDRKNQNTIGLMHKDQSAFHLLTLKQGVLDRFFKDTIPNALKKLDVTVLTKVIFMELLGFDQKRLDNEQLIGYSSQESNAIDKVVSREYDVVFLLNSTKIEQVHSVALNHLTMPRKSTYFYPKVISGLVQNLLIP
jgi:uncharacterized protein (DUF1015 family)